MVTFVVQCGIPALGREEGRSEVQGHGQQQSEFTPGLNYKININHRNAYCGFGAMLVYLRYPCTFLSVAVTQEAMATA